MDDNKKRDKTEFDPIKVSRDGKMAEQVIWSTNSINAAIDGINKGLQLKANPFIGKDTQLLKPNLVYKRTKDEVEDFKKCMFDPIYFASKCYIKTPTGIKPCVLRDYQIRYINHLVNNRFSILLAARQCGKTNFLTVKCDFSFPKKLVFSELSNKKVRLARKLLKSFYFYITDNNVIIKDVPMYELQNLFNRSYIWKLKYPIYKLISWLEKGVANKTGKRANVMLNTIKSIFRCGVRKSVKQKQKDIVDNAMPVQ